MKKAILIGNGVTSQLIENYKDNYMIECFKDIAGDLYRDINLMLEPYRQLPAKDEKSITALLKDQNIEFHHYFRYFIEQHLIKELDSPNIISLETLLKVAHLFHHIKDFSYDEITSIANKIYYNNGKTGLNAINNLIDKQKFKNFICTFDYVFTTNFDTVLDDVYEDEVRHLHGGFNYVRVTKGNATWINRTENFLEPTKAHLIWGRNADEKRGKSKGGIHFPITFPLVIGSSILEQYINELEKEDFSELHIWGYSGLNDGHINSKISNNVFINRIIVYVKPDEVLDNNVKNEKEGLFNKQNTKCIELKSWDSIWDLLK